MIYVGIDWSTRFHDVCITDEMGKIIKEFRIGVSQAGFANLLEVLASIAPPQDIQIGIEDGNNLLVDVLCEAEYIVYALNPKRVHRFKERYAPDAKKDDRFDAYNIALILVKDRDSFVPLSRSSDLCAEIRVHCETKENFVRARTRLMNQLWAHLNLYFPAFLGYFTDMNSNVTLRVLKIIANPFVFQHATEEDFLALLRPVPNMSAKRKHGLYGHLNTETVFVKSPGLVARAVRTCMLADQILALNASIKALDESVTSLFEEHPMAPAFRSLPRAGTTLAPRLVASLGDNQARFNSYQQVQCYAGTCPLTEKSGKWLRKVRMRRACNKSFRNTLYQFSFASMRGEKWAREYYDLMKSRGQSHSRAVRALANKWAKIIFRMWKENQPYDRSRFLKNRPIRPAA